MPEEPGTGDAARSARWLLQRLWFWPAAAIVVIAGLNEYAGIDAAAFAAAVIFALAGAAVATLGGSPALGLVAVMVGLITFLGLPAAQDVVDRGASSTSAHIGPVDGRRPSAGQLRSEPDLRGAVLQETTLTAPVSTGADSRESRLTTPTCEVPH